jgi:hypothetical protein
VLVNYIPGVAGQNAANARALASSKLEQSTFLAAVAAQWAQLDPAKYPSVHRARTQLREHDDREQFLAGTDLILAGIEAVNGAGQDGSAGLEDQGELGIQQSMTLCDLWFPVRPGPAGRPYWPGCPMRNPTTRQRDLDASP